MAVQASAFSVHEFDDPTKVVITNGERFEKLMRFLDSRSAFVFDYETSGLKWYQASEAVGIGFGAWDGQGRLWNSYTPFRHRTGEQQLDINIIGPAIERQLARTDAVKIAWNKKFEDHFSRREGWKVAEPTYDPMISSRLYDENQSAALEVRAASDLGYGPAAFEAKKMVTQIVAKLAKTNKMKVKDYLDKFGYSEVPINLCGYYCGFDLQYTGEAYLFYENWGVSRNYPRIHVTEQALPEVLCDMEQAGLCIDVPYLEWVREEMGRKKEAIEVSINQALHGWTFNWSSDVELRDFLWNKLGCRWKRLTMAGKKAQRAQGFRKDFDFYPFLSVDGEVLEQFSDQHPILGGILEWRESDKIESTYTTSILTKLDSNNYLHGSIKQMGAATGRMSCVEPNYTNIPSGPLIRTAFIVGKKGWVRLFLDYSQVELRVLAWYSKDPLMVETYLSGGDIHETTRSEVSAMVGRELERREAKIINFGLAYCLTEQGLSHQAKIPLDDAKVFLTSFFQRFSGVSGFRNELWAQARRQEGQWNNVFGRTRRLPELLDHRKWMRSSAERRMIGAAIQGTAADISKEALVRVHRFLKANYPDARLCNIVHDEFQIDTPIEIANEVLEGSRAVMQDFPEFHPIPIKVDAQVTGTNWGEKVTLKEWRAA